MFTKCMAHNKHSVNINYYYYFTYNLSSPNSPSKDLEKEKYSLSK